MNIDAVLLWFDNNRHCRTDMISHDGTVAICMYQGVEELQDYRYRPHESPKIWCVRCGKLVCADKAALIMQTTFHVEKVGIYPFGVCSRHLLP